MHLDSGPRTAADPAAPLRGYLTSPYSILAILAFVNFFNYVDRYVLAGLVPLLIAPPEQGGLGLSTTQTGLLQTAFMIVHSVASIPLGIVADRLMRKKLIALGVGVWSLATAAAGFARNFTQLFVSRAAVGIGEATYAPAASAMISERFSDKARARAMGVFQAGMVIGGGVGIMAGSVVGGEWGWRAAFFVVGVPGLFLTALCLMIAEAPRPAVVPGVKRDPITLEAKLVARSPGVVWIYLAGILITFTIGAIPYWGAEFVLRYHYGGDTAMLKSVGVTFGLVAVLSAAGGVVTGSWLADRIEARRPGRGRLFTVGLGPLLGAPFVAIGLLTTSIPLFYLCLGLGTFFNSFYGGPVLAALHDAVPLRVRATATGAYFFAVHLLGDAISPTIAGVVADSTGSLRVGLLVASGAAVLGGLAALRGALGRSANPSRAGLG